MIQCLLSLFSVLLMLLAPLLSLEKTQVPDKGDIVMQTEPAENRFKTFDRIDGVNSSVFYISRPAGEALSVVNAADFGLDAHAADNYAAFCAAAEYCGANPNTLLIINPGTYHFITDQTIMLEGLDNILIDAGGAVFVFEHDKYFYIGGCDGLEIRNLTVDWNWDVSRLGSLVRIENADTENHRFELVFTELDNVSADIKFAALTQYDAQTLTPGAQCICKENYIYQNPQIIQNVKKLENNVLQVTHDGSLDSFSDGEMYLLRHYVYGGSVFIVSNGSRNISFDNINIYSVAGMGFIVNGRASRFQILNTYIGLAPGHENERRVSATADAVHIADTNGMFRVKGCDFSFMGDDALNVHDNLMHISERVSDSAVRVYANSHIVAAGDTVGFRGGGYAQLDFAAEVVSISQEQAGAVITLDRTLPEDICADAVMFNTATDSGNYVITDNYFHENRARGLLLQSSNGLCTNNRFYKTMGQAIKIVMDIEPGLWYEGTGVNNLEISGNSFEMCNYSSWGEVITLGTNLAGKQAEVPVFTNIVVENNSFAEFPGYLIRASNVAGLTIRNNTVSNETAIGKRSSERGRIYIGGICGAVRIKDNRWKTSLYMPLGSSVVFDDISALI